jgi:hypothetical protein
MPFFVEKVSTIGIEKRKKVNTDCQKMFQDLVAALEKYNFSLY